MGRDKALIRIDGVPLVRRVAAVVARVADPVLLAPGRPGRLGRIGYEEVLDHAPGAGPLAGLVAGLAASPHPLMAVVAVDMPFASARVLALLAGLHGGEDAVVPVTASGPQPLHAVYASSALVPLRAALEQGHLAVRQAVEGLRVRLVTEAEWKRADPTGRFAFNLNRAEELAGLV
jgi:molybdopterin-guanine dinucleotide biosynthesis protein A